MNEKEKTELRQKYEIMEDDALIAIAFVDNADYNPEAIELAKAEIEKRNIPTQQQTEKTSEISKERQDEKDEIKNKPLTKKQKILFTIFPAWAIWYLIFAPQEWIQRRKDAIKAEWIGFALWAGLGLLVLFIHR